MPDGVATTGTWAEDELWRLPVATIGPGPAEFASEGELPGTWLDDWLCDVAELG